MLLDTGKNFMEKTKYKHLGKSDQAKRMPQPPLELPASEKIIHELPDPRDFKPQQVSVQEAINRRVSVRSYSTKSFSLAELSYLLWCTQGVKTVIGRSSTLRTVPSAGARHAFETYVLVNRVENLKPGLYRFLSIEHKLQEVKINENIARQITQACLNQRFILTSAVTFIWTVVSYRMKWRYQERGYRYMHIDIGHVCQNLYLSAETIDAGVCAIGAFDDDLLANVLGVDGEEEFPIYVGTCGKKR
ncbi:MAG: SagB/ThcOx family dehydrogenase [Promethearchaeota archaeon]